MKNAELKYFDPFAGLGKAGHLPFQLFVSLFFSKIFWYVNMYTDCCRLRLHSYLPLQRIKISSHPIVNGDIAAIIAFYLLCTLNRKKMSRTAVYPGTFDPVTNGHLDLIKRGLALFDQVIVAVAHNPGKMPMFDVHERVGFLKAATQTWKNITIDSFDTLLTEYVKQCGGDVIIKGLRAVSDFEYELQLSSMNRKLDSSIETVFMMPSEEFSFLSSRIIKEIAHLGGDVGTMVPGPVFLGLKRKFKL